MDNEHRSDARTDYALIAASFNRPEMFTAIFRRHFGAIHTYLVRRVGTPLADDLAALTFTTAFERRRTFKPDASNARPWLYGIATNLLRNHLRAERRLLHTIARLPVDELLEPPLDSDQALGRIDAAREAAHIADALEQLDPDQRDVLLLFAWAQLSYEEIGSTLGVPAGTVASRLSRARALLRSRLNSEADAAAPPALAPQGGARMIDELDALQHFRETVLPPTARVWVAAESLLAEAIGAERALLAVAERLDPELGAFAQLDQDLEPEQRLDTAATFVRKTRSRLVPAAVLALVVVAVVASVWAGDEGPAKHQLPAAASLAHLADIAVAQPALGAPGVGQYLYVRSIQTNLVTRVVGSGAEGSITVLQPETRQVWTASDGAGRLVETYGAPTFLSDRDEQNWVRAGKPSLTASPIDEVFAAGGLSGPDLTNLSTNPSVLAGQIPAVDGGPSDPGERFVQIGDLLRETDAPPALRGALLQVAAALPGVDFLGQTTDHLGRHGIGFSATHNGITMELILNPTTSALLGEQQTAAVDNPSNYRVRAGTIVGWAAYEASGLVSSTNTVPHS